MSTVKLTTASGGGTVSLAAPASTTSNAQVTLTLPQNDGDASQYLQTNGSGTLSFATVTPGTTRTIANADASSGSEIEFTSLDADAYWHRLIFFKVSTNNNTDFRLQAGTSSAYLTSSYKTSTGYLAGGSSNAVDGDTGWIRSDGLTNNGDTEVWEMNFMRAGTTNNWIARGTATQSSTNYYYWITSNFELSAALSKIKIYPVNSVFDAGNIYIESFK
tara:strand:+ start:53 stop:706 length:654 start_codon:yes stop_codon:yes gene_type:complete